MSEGLQVSQDRPTQRRRGRDLRDKGYVLALVALMLLPLLAFTGMAVDLGSWFARAATLQRVADAAALAGVSYLPDEGQARAQALAVAEKNGIVDGENGISIDVRDAGNQRLEVTITQEAVGQYFTSLFTDGVTLERSTLAEYVLPVALGSPRNFLGTGNLAGTSQLPGVSADQAEMYWLSVNGPCSSREQGDWLLPVSVGNWPFGNFRCWGDGVQGGPTNPLESYDPDGYFVGILIPEDYSAGPIDVDIYDAATQCSAEIDFRTTGTAFTTTFSMLDWDTEPRDPKTNPVILSEDFPSRQRCGGQWELDWATLYTIPDPQPGAVYFVQIQTHGNMTQTGQQWINSYAVRAHQSGSAFSPCSTDPSDDVPFSESCPQVFAASWLSIFASLEADDSFPSFYLAEIGPEHSGKIMEIFLYDIGEGTEAMRIIDPLGNPVAFDWEVLNETGSDEMPTGGWEGSTASDPGHWLDVRGHGATCDGNNEQPGPGRISSSKYNDRFLTLSIELPDDILEAYDGNGWWRVEYETCSGSGAAQSDRTTWGVVVRGDPVRLVR